MRKTPDRSQNCTANRNTVLITTEGTGSRFRKCTNLTSDALKEDVFGTDTVEKRVQALSLQQARKDLMELIHVLHVVKRVKENAVISIKLVNDILPSKNADPRQAIKSRGETARCRYQLPSFDNTNVRFIHPPVCLHARQDKRMCFNNRVRSIKKKNPTLASGQPAGRRRRDLGLNSWIAESIRPRPKPTLRTSPFAAYTVL